ncbi:MAG: hypothetical protein ABMA13_13020 [Chthoniobacteraceae bacterium]
MSRAFLILLAALATATAQVSAVRLRVEQVSKSNTTSYKTVQTRSLTIHLANSSTQPADVKVKWAVLGRDIKSKDVVTVEQGELAAALKPTGTEKLQTPAVSAAAEEARTGSKGKSDDIGTRIIGHGVQVWQGEKLVAEFYEPASLKESFGKAPVAQPLDKQKKK